MVGHSLKEVHLDNIGYELLAHVVTQKQNGAHAHTENKMVHTQKRQNSWSPAIVTTELLTNME